MPSRGQQTVSDRNTGKEGTVLLQAVGVGQAGGPERTTVATNSNKENFKNCPGQGELLWAEEPCP